MEKLFITFLSHKKEQIGTQAYTSALFSSVKVLKEFERFRHGRFIRLKCIYFGMSFVSLVVFSLARRHIISFDSSGSSRQDDEGVLVNFFDFDIITRVLA